jgi:hypothetical protein
MYLMHPPGWTFKALLFTFAVFEIGTVYSGALPRGDQNVTCKRSGATTQGATVSLEVTGLRTGALAFWNSTSPQFQIPVPHDGSAAHLNLGRFEPDQEISLDLWAHDQSTPLCTIYFKVEVRVIRDAIPGIDPYESDRGTGPELSNQSSELARLSTARQTKIGGVLDDSDDALRWMENANPSNLALQQEVANLRGRFHSATLDQARVSTEHDGLFSTTTGPTSLELASRAAALENAEDSLMQTARRVKTDTEQLYSLHYSEFVARPGRPPAPGGFASPPPEKIAGQWRIKVFYATDRMPSGSRAKPFTGRRDPRPFITVLL